MASNHTGITTESLDDSTVDAELLAGCRADDRAAQQKLYELCQQQVFRLAVRMVGFQEASDVMQQVFLQLFRKLNQFESKSQFSTWLYRLTVNEALQHLRRQKRGRLQPLNYDPMNPGPADSQSGENRELLELALKRVEPEQRSIFLLKEVEKLSYKEIAETLGIPEGTVGSRLNRVRQELQQHLKDLGWGG